MWGGGLPPRWRPRVNNPNAILMAPEPQTGDDRVLLLPTSKTVEKRRTIDDVHRPVAKVPSIGLA
jgi:hypothetical protein